MLDTETLDMLRSSLSHVLTESSNKPFAERLDELGWSDVLAEDSSSAQRCLFEVKGETVSPVDALSPLMSAAVAVAADDETLSGSVVALPGSLHSDGLSFVANSGQLTGKGFATRAPIGDETLLVPTSDGLAVVSASDATITELAKETIDVDSGIVSVSFTDAPIVKLLEDADVWQAAVTAGRWALSSELVAIGHKVIADAVEYTIERKQYGVSIGSFQAVQHRLASAYASVIGAGHVAKEAANLGTTWSAKVAKATAGRAAEDACTQAQQAYGAIGFTWEHHFHRYLRRTYLLDKLLGDFRTLEHEIGSELQSTGNIPLIGEL